MSDVTITYKGSLIATMDASGTKTLTTQGKYCEANIGVEYVKPAGPTGTKQISITQNGTTTEDVAAYANVEIAVNVSGGGGDTQEDLIKVNNSTLTSFSNSTVTSIRAYMFRDCSSLTSINIPNVDKIGQEAFFGCGLSGHLTIEKYLLQFANGAFRQCSISTATLKKGAFRLDASVFEKCYNLTAVDIGDTGEASVLNINGGAFYNTPNIATLIIRRSADVFPLGSAFPTSSALSSTATIYVPEALLSAYQSASNWSTYASRIVKIEGTTYETHWANGEAIS